MVNWLHLSSHFCIKGVRIEMSLYVNFTETVSDQAHQALQLNIVFF